MLTTTGLVLLCFYMRRSSTVCLFDSKVKHFFMVKKIIVHAITNNGNLMIQTVIKSIVLFHCRIPCYTFLIAICSCGELPSNGHYDMAFYLIITELI